MIALTALLIALLAIAAAHTNPSKRAPAGAGVVGISLGALAAIGALAALEFPARTPAP
jgi:malonyl CoA-acyl carrier protein transacylase